MNDAKPERIAKVIAAAGICSRRDAERLIEQGRVVLNGETLTTPATLVTPNDVIAVDGQKLKSTAQEIRVWRYYKPTGLVTTHRDEHDRPTVFERLPPHMPRVLSVGRLDLDSEGLLLLTNSGALSRAMELPKNKLERTYRVRVNGQVTEKHIHMLSRGVLIDGMKYQGIDVEPDTDKVSGRNRWLTVTLREGKNREIRRLFEYFGYPVSRLIRTSYGPFELGAMEPGKVEEVNGRILQSLLTKLELS